MKRLCISFFSVIFFATIAFGQHRIQVGIQGVADEDIYLGFYYGRVQSYVDTVRLSGGKAVFEGAENLAEGLYFIATSRGGFEILVADQTFSISVTAPDFINSMEVWDSPQCKGFNALQREITQNQMIYNDLAAKLEAARKDPAEVQRVRDQMEQLNVAINDFQSALIRTYEGTFLSKLVAMMTRPPFPKNAPKDEYGQVKAGYQQGFLLAHFFDNIDYQSSNLLMTPVYHARLNEYLDQLTALHPDSAIASCKVLLEKSRASRPFYRYTLTALAGKYETMRAPWANIVFDYLVNNYYLAGKADWMDDKLRFVLNAKTTTNAPKNRNGYAAPPIVGKTLYNELLDLNRVSGKYIVLYFYDPDCSYCRQQTPILKELYDRWKSKGVNVVAVNIGEDATKWESYIKEKLLDWVNVMPGETVSQLMQDYHIVTTPSLYVLDGNKKIAANYLKVGDLENFFSKKLIR